MYAREINKITVEGNRLVVNDEEVGVMELDKQKAVMFKLGCNFHYQFLKEPSLRVYAALIDTVRILEGKKERSFAGTTIKF